MIILFSSGFFLPAGERQTLHGAEDLAFHVRVFAAHGGEELFNFIALARLVHRAGVFHNGELKLCRKIGNLLLTGIDERANLRDAGAVQIGDGAEAAQPAFKQQAHHEGLHCIVKMVAERQLGDPSLRDGIVDSAPAHFGAERTGVILPAHIKHDFFDVSFQTGIGDAQLSAHFLHGGEIHPGKAKLNGDGLQFKGKGIIAFQMVQSDEQQHAVLPAGNPYGNPVSRGDHAVIIHGTPDSAGKIIERIVHKSAFW